MGLLLFPDGETFATGAMRYDYAPATPSETTNRIILPVKVENIGLTDAQKATLVALGAIEQ